MIVNKQSKQRESWSKGSCHVTQPASPSAAVTEPFENAAAKHHSCRHNCYTSENIKQKNLFPRKIFFVISAVLTVVLLLIRVL